jgi:hypothetical protein
MTWREFIRAHRERLLAVDFFTVETIWLQRFDVLELDSRRVHLAGCTRNPHARWVIQQGRQLMWTFAERAEPLRFLIRDRDQKFTDGFDEAFRSNGIEVVRTPFRAPQANGVAERFVRTIRSECLDCPLILDGRHLGHVLRVFVDHYNTHRPHRALALTPPQAARAGTIPPGAVLRIQRSYLHEHLDLRARVVAIQGGTGRSMNSESGSPRRLCPLYSWTARVPVLPPFVLRRTSAPGPSSNGGHQPGVMRPR